MDTNPKIRSGTSFKFAVAYSKHIMNVHSLFISAKLSNIIYYIVFCIELMLIRSTTTDYMSINLTVPFFFLFLFYLLKNLAPQQASVAKLLYKNKHHSRNYCICGKIASVCKQKISFSRLLAT